MVFNGPSPLPQENFEHFDEAKNEKTWKISNLFTRRPCHVECIIINSCKHQKFRPKIRGAGDFARVLPTDFFINFYRFRFDVFIPPVVVEWEKNDKRTNEKKYNLYRIMGVECSHWLAYDVIDVDVLNAERETLWHELQSVCVNYLASPSALALDSSAHTRFWEQSCGDAVEDDAEVLHIERIVHSSYLIMRSKFMCAHFACNSLEMFAGWSWEVQSDGERRELPRCRKLSWRFSNVRCSADLVPISPPLSHVWHGECVCRMHLYEID